MIRFLPKSPQKANYVRVADKMCRPTSEYINLLDTFLMYGGCTVSLIKTSNVSTNPAGRVS